MPPETGRKMRPGEDINGRRVGIDADGDLVVLPDETALERKRRERETERALASLRAEGHCPGCYLGDAGLDTHTFGPECEISGEDFVYRLDPWSRKV